MDSRDAAHVAVLDGLRGLAVVMVVLFHAHYWVGFQLVYPFWPQKPVVSLQTFATTGALGVDLFFLISGFVLFLPFGQHAWEGTRKPGWPEYTYRRFIKIVPSYLLALLAAAFVHRNDFPQFGALQKEVAMHASFLHGFSDYSFVSIDTIFWSLAIEVQFYVLFPLIVLIFVRGPIATWLAFLFAAFAYRTFIVWNGTATHFLVNKGLPAEIDLFVSGMFAAYVFLRWRKFFAASPQAQRWATAAALAAVVLLGVLFQSLANIQDVRPYNDELNWQAQHRSLLTLLYLVLALGSIFGVQFWRRVVANPVLVWLSVISYNLYLWHSSIMTACHYHGFPCALDPKPWTRNGWGEQFYVLSIVLSVAIATLVTYTFERPLLRLRPAWLRRQIAPEPPAVAPVVAVPPG